MTSGDDLFQQAMNAGHSAAWDGSWGRAAGFYRQALELSPNEPRALSGLALALYELEDYENSLRTYLQATRLAPEDPLLVDKISQLYERMGIADRAMAAAMQAAELYLKSHDAEKSIECWSRVLSLNPGHMQAQARLALVYERLGRPKEAAAEYTNLAALFQGSGNPEKAAHAIQHALQLSPGSEEAQRAMQLLQNGRSLPSPARPSGRKMPPSTIQAGKLKSVQEEDPDLDPVAEARGRALTMLASLLFDVVSEDSQPQATRRGLGAIVRNVGGSPARGSDPTRMMLHLSQVVDLQTCGQDSQALEELERAREAGLDHPAVDYDLGLLLSEAGRSEEALRCLQGAVKHPDFALGGHLLSGKELVRLQSWRLATDEYLEALRLADAAVVPEEQADDLRQLYEPIIESQRQRNDPEADRILCESVSSLLMRPSWRASLTEARRQLPLQVSGGSPVPLAEVLTQSNSSQVVESLSAIHQLADAGYLGSAIEEALFALQHAPTYLPLHITISDLLIQQGHLPEAISKLMVVARTYSIRGETRRAIELYHRLTELAPMDLVVRANLIDLLVTLGKIDETLEEYMNLAQVHYDLANLDQARKTYVEALQLTQGMQGDHNWRVRILHRMADIDLQRLEWRQALRLFEQIRDLQPEDEKARQKLVELNYRLGQENQALAELDHYTTFLKNGGQKASAASFLEAVLVDLFDRPLVRMRLGELYAQMGRPEEALSQLDAAGEGYLQAGDRDGAATAVKAILALNPSNVQEYQQLLDQLQKI